LTSFEPPDETHTLVVPVDLKEMATLFHATGGTPASFPRRGARIRDVFTELEHASRHYEAVGKEHVKRIIR
jgi:2,4'-dihydroxyacetophenone dioxygenase